MPILSPISWGGPHFETEGPAVNKAETQMWRIGRIDASAALTAKTIVSNAGLLYNGCVPLRWWFYGNSGAVTLTDVVFTFYSPDTGVSAISGYQFKTASTANMTTQQTITKSSLALALPTSGIWMYYVDFTIAEKTLSTGAPLEIGNYWACSVAVTTTGAAASNIEWALELSRKAL